MVLLGDYAPGSYAVCVPSFDSTVVINLEGPILPPDTLKTPAPKAGPHLSACQLPSFPVKAIFALANNHLMDYGVTGLAATMKVICARGDKYCGAGHNLTEARAPVIITTNQVSIGIISCCEAQFGMAAVSTGGVADFGSWVFADIQRLREVVDVVIVSCHAGLETSPWPFPCLRNLYRAFIDCGATIIHGHHAHVPQGYERHGTGIIFYGLGNFAVPPAKWRKQDNALWSVGVELDFEKGRHFEWRLVTFEIVQRSDTDPISVYKSTPDQHALHLNFLEECNRPLSDDSLYSAVWQEVALRAYFEYGARYLGLYRSIPDSLARKTRQCMQWFKRLGITPPLRSTHQQDHLLWQHLFSCESHRQMMITALGLIGGSIRDVRTEASKTLCDRMLPHTEKYHHENLDI